MRIRVPDQWWGDYLAMIGAARIGERELLALGAEVGWEALHAHRAGFLRLHRAAHDRRHQARCQAGAATRRSTHDAFPGTPDGAASPISADGRASIPRERRIEVDLRDNPDCMPCGLNLSEASARTAAMIGIFSSLGEPVPRNAGSYRRVRILLRPGSCVGGAAHPASCSLSTTNLASRIGNATQSAIAEIADGFGMANPA